ncbi:MAG: prolyl oligopeptidase family serine peptidase, partial [Planctomycetota bacterium]
EQIWSGYSEIYQVRANSEFAVFCAGDPKTPLSLYSLNLATGKTSLLKSSSAMPMETLSPFISLPTPITFPTGKNEVAYGFYYPPTNPHFKASEQEKPPLILQCHGGPTGATTTTLDWEIQYFTSRGFGMIDINYRGSSGYGRQFRLSLYKNWGVYDPEDCLSAAQFLIQKGLVNPKKIVARGGSAGGYTTLCLLTSSTLCCAGASYFGISNMEMIAQHSDKLELHYPDQLVGIYPDEIDLYRERSPVHHADRVQAPLIFFQGMEDPIVPPEQTQVMVDSLDKRKIPHAAFYFPNEQHGFRSAENIKKALESEYYFYAQIIGFSLGENLPPIEIKHWKKNNLKEKTLRSKSKAIKKMDQDIPKTV